MTVKLKITGEVTTEREFSYEELCALDDQVIDVSKHGLKRGGDAVKLSGLLAQVGVSDSAQYIGLHASTDDFHASVPLAPIRDRALLVYRADDQPLEVKAGGPFRFFIPDHAACHTDEIDECANVKFVDHIEITVAKGYDNRPEDDEEHEKLHQHDADH